MGATSVETILAKCLESQRRAKKNIEEVIIGMKELNETHARIEKKIRRFIMRVSDNKAVQIPAKPQKLGLVVPFYRKRS